jgi:hypothetical protein
MTLKLLFAGDGPRDEATVPRLVSRLLGAEIEAVFEAWRGIRLQGGAKGLKGYGRKLLFLIRLARDRDLAGVVATVDCDRGAPREKLRDLMAARSRDREAGHAIPVALGEAIPHLEAWLLDDPVAVRTALELPTAAEIKSPSKVDSPKAELHGLHRDSTCDLTEMEMLAAVARMLDVARCNHCDSTGLAEFCREVHAELGPLCNSGPTD